MAGYDTESRSAAEVRRRWFGPARGGTSVIHAPAPPTHIDISPRRQFPIRVLVADDDEIVRQTLLEAIEQTDGIVVIGSAKDAAEAIRIASIRHPDVALLDVRMPGGGGPRAAREIRSRSPDTYIVALSAYRDDRSVEHMLASGATSYLVKDSDLDDIMQAVTRSVEGVASLSTDVTQHVVSELGTRLSREHGSAAERFEKQERIRRFIGEGGGLSMVYQPIVELSSGRVAGVEALARFSSDPKRAPDVWFEEAVEMGLGTALQVAAVERALAELQLLPPDIFLSVNVDPTAVASSGFRQALKHEPHDRIVIELTEHAPVSDYPSLRDSLDAFRRSGVRIAVDDAGAGNASLRHILEVAPDIIKIDKTIVRNIDSEAAHRALASALIGFAREIGTELVAEGVETAEEALTLHSLGIRLIQGYFAARPGPIPDRFEVAIPGIAHI